MTLSPVWRAWRVVVRRNLNKTHNLMMMMQCQALIKLI